MGFAVITALCLCGQDGFPKDDTLNQWESRLLESKWVLTDPATGVPHVLLVLRDYTPSHRIFQLTIYHHEPGLNLPWAETWTGTYKMEARKAGDGNRGREDDIKLARLHADQYWLPVERNRPESIKNVLEARGLIDWTDEINYIDWLERKDFKPFFAELIFDAPFLRTLPELSGGRVAFFLRSDEVTKIGWWNIGTTYVLSPVHKR